VSEIPIDSRRAAATFTSFACRLIVGGVFATASVLKLKDLLVFAREVRAYRVVPDSWSHVVANTVAPLELVAALLLITGVWRREARWIIGAMLAGFTALKLYVLAAGIPVHDCGCFGKNWFSELLRGGWGIAFNAALLVLLLVSAWADRRVRTPRAARAAAPAVAAAT
jgi:uncharacterized membrane protein YphA (DoxX/SURF4 family)